MKYNNEKILKELEEAIKQTDFSLRDWSLQYFHFHRKRYLSDLEIIEELYQMVSGGEILEIGAIPCHITFCLKKLGYPTIGLDLYPERMKEFIEKYNLKVVKCNIEKDRIPFEDNRFKLILFNEVFEHLRIDPIHTLREINRILHPEGILMLTTPNLYSLDKIIRFLLGKGFNDPYEEFKKLYTLGHMGHIREYSTYEIKKFLEKTGFNVIHVMYKYYNKSRNLILDTGYSLIPRFRPFQIVICKKI